MDIAKLNNLNFKNIDKKKFPVINILDHVSKKFSLYETVIVSANDLLVQFFLEGKILCTFSCTVNFSLFPSIKFILLIWGSN